MKRILFILLMNGFVNLTYSMECVKTLYTFFNLDEKYIKEFPADLNKNIASVCLADKQWWYLKESRLHSNKSSVWSPSFENKILTKSGCLVQVWDTTNSTRELARCCHDDVIYSAKFNSSGTQIVTTSDDRTARIWDITQGGRELARFSHNELVHSAKFNSSGTQIVTTSYHQIVQVWDAKKSEEMIAIFTHDKWVNSAEFDFSGKKVVTASSDCTARVWDVTQSEKELIRFTHNEPVSSAQFNASGTKVLTIGDDCIVRMWDATKSEKELAQFTHKRFILSAQFGKTDNEVLTKTIESLFTWKRYHDYTLQQMLFKKLLFLWWRVKKPNKSIDSLEEFFQDPLLLLLIDQDIARKTWQSFEATEEGKQIQQALWESLLDKIKRYGVENEKAQFKQNK